MVFPSNSLASAEAGIRPSVSRAWISAKLIFSRSVLSTTDSLLKAVWARVIRVTSKIDFISRHLESTGGINRSRICVGNNFDLGNSGRNAN